MSGECNKCHEHCLDCKCKSFNLDISHFIESIKPMSNDYAIKIEGYTTSNPRIKGNEIWIDITPQWISVKDRLPLDDEDVLVYHSYDFHITVGCFEKDNVSYYIESDGSKFYTDDGWETEIPWAQKGPVTYWIPLPQPPMEKAHQAEGSAKDSQSVDPDQSK